MSYIVMRPLVTTVTTKRCGFHERHPSSQFPGCTCSTMVSSREKNLDEMTAEEKAHYFAALGGERPDGTPLFG